MLLALFALLAAQPSSPPIAPLTPAYDPLAKGSMGFSFAFPLGGHTPVGTNSSTIGVTYLLNDNLAARVDFGLEAVLSPSGTPAVFNIGVGLRAYQLRKGPVAIYIFPQFTFGRAVTAGIAAEFINLTGGVGAEYFFADHFSVGGQLGIGLNFGNIGGPAGSSVSTQLTTSTSGLFASVYF